MTSVSWKLTGSLILHVPLCILSCRVFWTICAFIVNYMNVTNICGFTREVLSALIANVEMIEFRRQEVAKHSLAPETPRASNNDDIECFFSFMRDLVGTHFMLKQAQFAWRNIFLAHDRFYEGSSTLIY